MGGKKYFVLVKVICGADARENHRDTLIDYLMSSKN
jgi:hypothetical protein